MQLDPDRVNIIMACLRMGCVHHQQKAARLQSEMRFAEARQADEFAKACLMIVGEFQAEAKKSGNGSIR